MSLLDLTLAAVDNAAQLDLRDPSALSGPWWRVAVGLMMLTTLAVLIYQWRNRRR